jgi:hypothetical protein
VGARGNSPKNRPYFLGDVDIPLTTHFYRSSPMDFYEQEKRRWTFYHPEATPAEYSAAMLEIARRCGV